VTLCTWRHQLSQWAASAMHVWVLYPRLAIDVPDGDNTLGSASE
jgi:hypothetical protein